MNKSFEVTFLGTNGSCAYNNGKRRKYGSNTACVAVSAGGKTLIFDTGTGICGFSALEDYQRDHISIFYSHYHIDHLQGLMFCPPLFNPKNVIDIFGASDNDNLRSTVNVFLSPPFNPTGLGAFNANINFHHLMEEEMLPLTEDLIVHTYPLSHSGGGAVGYRVEYDGKSFCYCPDVELADHRSDSELLNFMSYVDLLVLDSSFDHGKVIEGWGHSSWKECAEWSKRANVKKLALFHYGFNVSDEEIDEMDAKAKEIFPGAFAAADFMKVKL